MAGKTEEVRSRKSEGYGGSRVYSVSCLPAFLMLLAEAR